MFVLLFVFVFVCVFCGFLSCCCLLALPIFVLLTHKPVPNCIYPFIDTYTAGGVFLKRISLFWLFMLE